MYIHDSVSTDKVLRMLKQLQEYGAEIHEFCMYRKGEKMLEFAPTPYHVRDKRRVCSVSKAFTATAVGLCYDRGLVDLETPALRYFPETMTKNADPKLQALTVGELLTMCTGIKDAMPGIDKKGHVLQEVLSCSYESIAQGFFYNNTASFLLSALVSQIAGCSALDLLRRELFVELGITGVSWAELDGICVGAAGLRVSADDIAKMMLLYSNGGKWKGKQLLSEEWVRMATSYQVSTEFDNPYQWYTKGYGFQFWHNKLDGYRADGAGGQRGFVFPALDVVLAIEGKTVSQWDDAINDTYYALCADFQGVSTFSKEELETYLDGMYQPLDGNVSGFSGFDKDYVLGENPMGFTMVRLSCEGDAVACELSDGSALQTVRFGLGNWQENRLTAYYFRRELYALIKPQREVVHFAASCKVEADGTLAAQLRFRDCQFTSSLLIKAGEKLEMYYDGTDSHITGKRWKDR